MLCPMLPASLNCRFLIAPSVFSNVMHWFSVHLSSIIDVCRKLECFNLLQPTRHLSNEEGDSCPLAWWSIWNVKYVGRSEKNLINGSWRCMVWLKDPIHFSRCLQMIGVSHGSYISKTFSPIATSSHDIVMEMLSVICQSISLPLQLVGMIYSWKCCQLYDIAFLCITTSSQDIVMEMLSVICQSISPPLQLVVTVLLWKCCQLYVKAFLLHYI